MNPRPITRGHLWLAFALPSFTSCKASVFSRLQRAVSVQEIALPFLQRSLRGSVSGRYPIIPLLRISVRKSRIFSAFSAAFTSFQALSPVKVYLQQRVAAPSFYSFGLFRDILPRGQATFFSMAFCAVLTALGCLFLLKQKKNLPHWNLFYYSIPAVFSVLWTYANGMDHTFLFIWYALVFVCFWDIICQKGVRISLFLIAGTALLWMIRHEYLEDCLLQFWVFYFPGGALDNLFANFLPLAAYTVMWLLCYFCAAPGKIAGRFRELL